MKRQDSATSSGFVISDKRILGNAHGVAFHSVVRIRKHGTAKKYIAKVLHVGHECDLAMLTVEDEEFWKGLEPLTLGGVPHLQDMINVVGYPTGGDNISVTQGIVSRVGVGKYSHTEECLLAVQIDAAINAGNSGGPAIKQNHIVGVAFETLDDAENIGYIIPTPVIKHFLNDIEQSGKYLGFCSLGIHWQTIENKGMISALKLPKAAAAAVADSSSSSLPSKSRRGDDSSGRSNGILIRKVEPLTDTAKVLKSGDVLLKFDDHNIASDGTVVFRGGERVLFNYLVTSKYVGDSAEVTFVRSGKMKKAHIKLGRPKSLVRTHMFDRLPSYYIYGGLVFTALSYPYLENEFGKKWDKKAPIKLCDYAFFGIPKKESEQVVILNQVLISDVNIGYESFTNIKVLKVDDTEILNLSHLVTVVTEAAVAASSKFITVHLEQDHLIIIDINQAKEKHDEILRQNNIPSDISDDLKKHVQTG